MSTTQTQFSRIVRDTLLDNKLAGRKPDSIRGLARAMANGDQSRAETFKRSLFKWMAAREPNPSRESRALVADALGIDRDALADDDDEESSSMPLTGDEFQLLGDLMARLGRTLVEARSSNPPPQLEAHVRDGGRASTNAGQKVGQS